MCDCPLYALPPLLGISIDDVHESDKERRRKYVIEFLFRQIHFQRVGPIEGAGVILKKFSVFGNELLYQRKSDVQHSDTDSDIIPVHKNEVKYGYLRDAWREFRLPGEPGS